MKTLILALAIFASLPANAASLELGVSPKLGEAHASVSYGEKSVLGARLFSVLKASPLFAEDLGGGYIEPGTRYVSQSKGMAIEKAKGGSVTLSIAMNKNDRGGMISGSTALIVDFIGDGDMGSLLHTALLTSNSNFVLTKDHPSNEIKPQGDEAVLLSEVSFYGEYISCGTYMNGAVGRCSISLNRQ